MVGARKLVSGLETGFKAIESWARTSSQSWKLGCRLEPGIDSTAVWARSCSRSLKMRTELEPGMGARIFIITWS